MPVISIDSPTNGWNAFDSLSEMPPNAAVILNNLIPGAGDVETRKGHIVYEDLGTGLPVETLASFNTSTLSQLIAASNGGLWEIDDSPAEARALGLTNISPELTFQNDRWQTENFQKSDENGIMVMCNGADLTQVYDGTAVAAIDTTGTVPPLTPTFIGCLAFKGRMYYWLPKDNSFWYSQAGSYQGELQEFDLGTFVQDGGSIITAFTWTQQDSGDGRDDFIVFVFSTGEILVYQGDDPQTAGYFEQVGRYRTAEPLSPRGYVNYGADAIIMTRDGYVSMASIIQEGRTSDVPKFSRLIHREVIQRTQTNATLFGWDVELFQREGLLIFNVPLSDLTYEQHVMNTVTQKWCRFNSLNVNCIKVHDERLFGGMNDGTIVALLETTSDNGKAIEFDCLYAFNYLSDPGYQKHVVAAQVLTTHSNPQDIILSAWADFKIPSLSPIPQPTALPSATWSVNPPAPPSPLGSEWNEEYWSGEGTPFTTRGWQNVSAYGFAVALLVRFSKVNETVSWRSSQVRFYQMGAE